MKIGVIAIHGGNIEPGTSEVARAIAGENLSLFINETPPHIPSVDFDNDEIREFLGDTDTVISIHGEDSWDDSFVMVGGLDFGLSSRIKRAIKESGFKTKTPPENLDGDDPQNICNRGQSGKGVQLELSQKLRNELVQSDDLMKKFAESIRVELW